MKIAIATFPEGSVKRDLKQTMHVWRSLLDLHMALGVGDPDLNLHDYYKDVTYTGVPDACPNTAQRVAHEEAARRAADARKARRKGGC